MKFIIAILLAAFSVGLHARSITADSWLVADSNGTILQSENINEVRPIASISKLMTAMIVLDADQNLDEKVILCSFSIYSLTVFV